MSTNNTQNWNSNFTFKGTQNLNLGTGTVSLSVNVQLTVTANTLTVGGAIGGRSLGITKLGSGTLALANTNTYTGSTTISAGTLQIAGGTTQASAFTVQNGAALAVVNPVSTATATLSSSLTFSAVASDATTLNLNAASNWAPGAAALLSVGGTLTTNGASNSTTINVSTTAPFGVGTYNLIGYAGGSVHGTGFSAFTLAPVANSRVIAMMS